VLWSMAIGVLTLLVWIGLDLRHQLHEVFASLLLSTLTYCALSRATPQGASK